MKPNTHIAAKYATREGAAKAIAYALGYQIFPGRLFETYEAFANAIDLPADGSVPFALRQRADDYMLPPLDGREAAEERL